MVVLLTMRAYLATERRNEWWVSFDLLADEDGTFGVFIHAI